MEESQKFKHTLATLIVCCSIASCMVALSCSRILYMQKVNVVLNLTNEVTPYTKEEQIGNMIDCFETIIIHIEELRGKQKYYKLNNFLYKICVQLTKGLIEMEK